MGSFDPRITTHTPAARKAFLDELRRSEDLHGSSYGLFGDKSGVFELFLKPEPAPQHQSFLSVYMNMKDFCTLYKKPSK
jgi:hypothetical protein